MSTPDSDPARANASDSTGENGESAARESEPAPEPASASGPARGGRAVYWIGGLLTIAALVFLGRQWHRQQPPQRYGRAIEALDKNDLAGVRRELNGWPNSRDYDAHRHLLTGALLYREGKPGPALNELQRCFEQPELRVRALTMAGGALYQLQQQADAVGLLGQALELDPQAVDAHRWIASCYYDLGAIHHALEHLNKVAELDPNDPRPHRLIGLMHKDFEHYDEAIAAYRESLRRSAKQPDEQELRIELAECLAKQLDYDGVRATLAGCSDSAEKLALEAECERAAGKADEAARLVAKALESSPGSLAALQLQGTLRLEAGDTAGAAESFGRAVERHPHDYTVRYKYSQALQRNGRTKEAAEQSERAEATKKLYEKFTALHERAAKQPDDVEVRYDLGRTAVELGRPDLAFGWFRMTLALDPRHQGARRALQELPPPGG